ncbi:outer membrane beta-barrel protein [Hymenobacter sp. GOD-10R]|uniref:outer membrane beta-barrel protein n=1 Tax=Hymenobacter sp. GOD-10R TaxID=3093922 RepID=UPI002D7760AE|nr:outer membrane beta-barrel protein [Hymenobacter sp. GOD-10R]WRQ31042.1 outer membrane beta-barrel protein [Hymenobacter sp. GOD-10R]
MKRFFSLLAFLLLTSLAAPAFARTTPPAFTDTIVVKLPNQAIMTLFVKNKAQLRQMRNYKLDSLMILLDTYITQAETAGKNSKNGQVTMEFYPDKDQPGKSMPEQIRVTVRNSRSAGSSNDHVEVRLGPSFGVVVDDDDNGDNVKVHVGHMDTSNRDSVRKAKSEARFNRPHHSNFTMDLGLNTLVNRGKPALGGYDYALRPLGSRYISFQWRHSWRLGAVGSPLYLVSGPEVAFNNYMFDNNARLFTTDTQSYIDRESTLNLQKSKLATTTLNLPLMAQLYFRDQKGHESFRLSAGGFAGYRLSSHTKLKYDRDGSTKKDKDRGSYNLEDFQYGLQGIIGVRGLDLFVKYNLNDLFKENRGPQAQTLSFGITFL